MKRSIIRSTARFMLCILTYQLVVPATRVFALTSGPSQPEVESFEPVGTTEMVDLFSGDFVYNIPLMDVEGYPINISYHSGVNMEQEASWVGLGWNINPGEINRGVRGLPDDFNGDTLSKFLNIKPEKDYRMRIGANAGFELFGALNLGVSAGQFISYNNYKGVGIGMDVGAQLSTPVASTGIGIAVGSLDGATVDASAGLSFRTTQTEGASSGSISFSANTGFNTRSGLKDISYDMSLGIKSVQKSGSSRGGVGFGSSIPIGLQNYVAVTTNATMLQSFSLQVKFGVEFLYTYPHVSTTMSFSTLSHEKNGSMPAYGYLFAQNAVDKGIMDFSREKDGVYNSTLPNLPLSSMTYDVYAVNGQGTGGMFRPIRNDVGTIYDPKVSSAASSNSFNFEFGMGVGPVGGLFEFGTDFSLYRNAVESGPWYKRAFRSNVESSLFENVSFKQGGELTYSLQQEKAAIADHNPVYVNPGNPGNLQIIRKGGASAGSVPGTYGNSNEDRSPRANHLSFLTNGEAAIKDATFNTKLESYPANGFLNNNVVTLRDRTGNYRNKAKSHQIGEITQVLADGRRYIYGLPAMNNVQREATFSVNGTLRNTGSGMVKLEATDDNPNNGQGREHYFQATYTPAYAHSYLLTSALSPDYMDVTGDGPTEDDLGSYTKFNYTLTDGDYRWITPIQAREGSDSVQYNPGFWSDAKDDKGNYITGSKEMLYLHSVESKNYVAEFYTSPRNDGRGVQKRSVDTLDFGGTPTNMDPILTKAKSSLSESYKLDSIKLYNKHDRFVNQNNAVPIKTVIFDYDYVLCPGTPNSVAPGGGKLTLRRIYFRYGKSDKSLLNPYVFTYDLAHNPSYNFASKDRWGNFKRGNDTLTSYEFPYVKQNKIDADTNAANWHLEEIKLPSGGRLKIKYEADDYSYVQDKRTMEMFQIAGVGAGTSYEPRDILYQSIDEPYPYIYFRRDKSREVSGKSFRENYLENTDMLYFSFNVDIAARNAYEYIRGYAKVEDVGYCDNNPNSDYGYIKVRLESAGQKSDKKLNPITLAGLNTGRYYLPHIIYPGYNEGEPGDMEVLAGLIAATKEMLSIWQNANVRFVKNGLSCKFAPSKSWIRLHTPGYTKIGGGSRVQQLTLEDSWNQMNAAGDESLYGRTYDYTTLKDNNLRISSGVASYEPMIGADENPFRNPVKYTADGGRLMPAIELFQEEPFGESFYPAPSVGYSKVTVRSIHKDIAQSAKAEDVHEFYTAKDFPVEVDFTEKNTPIALKHRGLTNKEEHLRVLQGYALRMNDMHGKIKALSNYVIRKDASSGTESRELVTSTRYNYNVDAQGKLNNRVKAVKRNGLVGGTYSIPPEGVVLGEEVDFTMDSRRREMEASSVNVNFNLNVVNFLFVTVPIPTIFFPDNNEHSLFETLVATKIIQQYGILKSVEVIDHGARTTTEHELFDAETGQVLLSKVNNEFNDPIHNLSYPAYWAYDNMGPSYYNVGYEERVDSVCIDNSNRGHLMGVNNMRYFNKGDELMMRYRYRDTFYYTKVWVTGTGNYANPDPNVQERGGAPSGPCTIVVEPRAKSPGGYPTFLWFLGGTVLKDASVKVIRSGRRNQLNSSVQQMVINGDYQVNSFADLFSSPRFGTTAPGSSAIVSAGVTTYKDEGLNEQFTSSGLGGSFGFNAYIRGEKGTYRPWTTLAWAGPRNYNANHARKNGLFSTYVPFWLQGMYPTDSISCSLNDYVIVPNGDLNWKTLKEVVAYNAYGLPVEEKDAAGISSTAVYANNYTLPVAIGSNARNRQIKYLGFEDLLQMQQDNKRKLGIWELLRPNTMLTVSFVNNGKKYWKPQATEFVQNASVTEAQSHTGRYSMLLNGPATIPLTKVTDFAGVNYCYVSLWVKPVAGAPVASQFLIHATGTDANQNGIAADFTMFAIKTPTINGWYKLEGKMDMSLLSAYSDIALTGTSNYYVDDIRMMPDEANMKSFAYDLLTGRLMAELDANNFATFYEYDQEGVLVRVKKETERGILTVNEHRKSNAKNIQ